MSHHNSITHNRGSSRPWLGLVLLLGLLLLGWVTALTTSHNPYYSDRNANGISKYHFLRECREQAHHPEKLKVSMMGEETPLKTVLEQGRPFGPKDTYEAALEAPSREVVAAINPVTGGGWAMTTPVTLSVTRGGVRQVLGQLLYQCSHDKKTNKTNVVLQFPGQ